MEGVRWEGEFVIVDVEIIIGKDHIEFEVGVKKDGKEEDLAQIIMATVRASAKAVAGIVVPKELIEKIGTDSAKLIMERVRIAREIKEMTA